MKAFLALLVLVQIFATTGAAQERFIVTPNRGGAEGARQTIQLQQETNRGIAHQISITAVESNVATVSSTVATVSTTLSGVSTTATANLNTLRTQVTVSLTSAGDVSCGNQGMLMGPSHTIAVGNCVPALTINSQGHTVLSGGVRLGTTGNCDATMSGMLRYQEAQKSVQFCDGTSWQEVGATPALSGPFNAVTNAEPSTVITSNNTSLTGFAGERTATVTPGATIVVNGTAIGAAANVKVGDTIALRVASSSSFDSAVNVNFTVSSIVANWSVTTRSQDTTPNAFTFTNLTNQALSTVVMSEVVTVSGFDGPLTVNVAGGGSPQIQIAGGSWVSSGSINPGQTLRVRLTTSSSGSTAQAATVTAGTYNTGWSATTNSGPCNLPWGGTINHGQSVTAFQAASVSCGQTCQSQTRACSAGVLSGSFTQQSCSIESCGAGPWQTACAVGTSVLGGTCAGQVNSSPGVSYAVIFAPSDNTPRNAGTNWVTALSTCENLVLNGYDDWYVSGWNDWNAMYPHRAVVGGFSSPIDPPINHDPDSYWTPGEDWANGVEASVGCRNFGGPGHGGSYFKAGGKLSRCVRRAADTSDPCGSASVTPGTTCTGGAKFAGTTPSHGGRVWKLMAAEADAPSALAWTTPGFNQMRNATDQNRGWYNPILTGLINPSQPWLGFTPPTNHPAQLYCWDLVAHGYDDWYLPASNELNVLYSNRAAIGNFDTGAFSLSWYWSSTEQSADFANDRRFFNGSTGVVEKGTLRRVRCVRRF
jgi:hypothetical protein